MSDSLIRKVKALAEAGVGGEKTNAESLLQKLMKKYGLTDKDLESEEVVEFSMRVPKIELHRKLMVQLLHICGYKKDERFDFVGAGKNTWHFKAPIAMKVDFMERFDFYIKHLETDIETFYLAFLYKNNLVIESTEDDTDYQDKKKDEEEIKRHQKALSLAMGLERHHIRKSIGYGGK